MAKRSIVKYNMKDEVLKTFLMNIIVIPTIVNKLSIIKNIIKQLASVNFFYREKFTPLMLASRNGEIEIMKELINAGALVDIIDSHGQSALAYAAASGNIEAFELLVNNNADLTIPENIANVYYHSSNCYRKKETQMLLLSKESTLFYSLIKRRLIEPDTQKEYLSY